MRWLIPLLLAGVLSAQRHEAAFTLGRATSPARTLAAGKLDPQAGNALQAVYGIRVARPAGASLHFDLGVLSVPLRDIATANPQATKDFATLYVTPALRLKFLPSSRISPWVTGGGGYALYEQSVARTDGQPNSAPRLIHRGQVMFGGGVDVRMFRWLAVRGEVRDFYTGSPAFNIPQSGGQHNIVVGGGFVLRFGE